MAVPTLMADLSVTAASNSPAGTENPTSTDDFHRAIQSILRHTNAKGADIASATTTDIGAATGEFVDVTGTTTITGLGTIASGIVRTVRFTGALTLTHNATSLILPGAANITTVNGDVAVLRSLGSGNWKCIGYLQASAAMQQGFSVAAHATTCDIWTGGNFGTLTGAVVTFTDVADAPVAGAWRWIRSNAAHVLTDGANIAVEGNANYTLADGDLMLWHAITTTTFEVYIFPASGVPVASVGITLATEQASTSGTLIDFTSIPAGTKRITVMFNGVSTNGTSDIIVQLGDAGGVENTGYVGSNSLIAASSVVSVSKTDGFGVTNSSGASDALYGAVTLFLENAATFTWIASGSVGRAGSTGVTTGRKALSAELDRIRITTSNGTDAFDAGALNIQYGS